MSEIKDFKINFDETRFSELRRLIADARFPALSQVTDWELGTPAAALRKVLDYWASNAYSWKKREDYLNGYPQYLVNMGDMTIHLFHVKAEEANAPTILMCHGWPDSFLRYDKTFPLLKRFNIVVPTMPGFGFSTLPAKGFINNSEVADLWHDLMRNQLGYDSYFVTGGDMGRGVASYLASRYPDEVKGVLLTDAGLVKEIFTAPDSDLAPDYLAYKKSATEWLRYDGAYINIQSTKPLSLGYGLNCSPVGMAGWLFEKFHDWSDWERFSMDDLCDNLTLYWMTGCAATSVMAYHGNSFTLPPLGKITAPIGFVQFPKDILPAPKRWIENQYNPVQYTEMPFGGHFTAMEAPEAFSKALSDFIDALA